jgi:zinc transporter
MKAFRFSPNGSVEELALDQPIGDLGDGWLWLHFNLEDSGASDSLGALTDLPQSARESLLGTDNRQQLHADATCVFGVFADIARENQDLEIGFVRFAMTERYFVSGRKQAEGGGDTVHQILQKSRKLTSVASLLEAIVEGVVDAADDYASDLAEELSDVEESILSDELSDTRQMLGRMRRTAVQLHRQLDMSRSLIRRLEREDFLPSKSSLRPATNKLDQRLISLDSEIVALRDRSHLLQEEVTLKLAERTNRHLEVLSIVATVFLPASLVAGIFGMNVKGLPLTQTEYGFAISIGLILGISVFVFWLLRRSGVVSS